MNILQRRFVTTGLTLAAYPPANKVKSNVPMFTSVSREHPHFYLTEMCVPVNAAELAVVVFVQQHVEGAQSESPRTITYGSWSFGVS